ncbi:MAG: hypothetical protein ACK6AT_19795 [Planctomycetota bacterium]
MSNSIEFMDCVGCGKRVRTTAERCHRCGKELVGDSREHRYQSDYKEYDEHEEDFDYQEFLEREFGQKTPSKLKPWWWYVAWLVLAVMVIGIALDALRLIP